VSTGEKYPGYPDSIRQSTTNPIQMDRVRDMGNLASEFPVAPLQRKKLTYAMAWWALLALIVGILPTIADTQLPVLWAFDIWCTLGVVASLVVLLFCLGPPKSILAVSFFVVALPLFAIPFVFLRSSFGLLLLASVTTAMFSDAYAKQVLYLGTTSPFSRARAKFIRTKWRTRLFSFNTVRGLEFYGLGLTLLISTPWILFALQPQIPTGDFLTRIPAVGTTIALIFCMPVLIEIIAALFYARKTLGIRTARLGFRRSLQDWIAYNYYNLKAPGVFVSPVGSGFVRRMATVAVFCLWIAALSPLFSSQIGISESIRHSRLIQVAESQKEKREAEAKADSLKSVRAKSKANGFFLPANVATTPARDETSQPPKSQLNQLEPFQERMLQRMPPEEREAYIRQLMSIPTANSVQSSVQPQQTPITDPFLEQKDRTLRNQTNPQATDIYSEVEVLPIVPMFEAAAIGIVLPKATVIFFAVLFPLAFIYANSVRIASSLREQLEQHPDSILSLGNWDKLTSDVAASEDATEKNSILLGVNANDNSPVLVPTKVFEEHAHILGDSGSGKTSMGISLILNQLIRKADCSIVVIDLKGDDMALFDGARKDAESAGKRFRWFTNELGRSTHAFNPLDQEFFHPLSLYQKTDIITAALGLQYGTDYGRGYFADANSDYLYRTLQAHPDIKSFSHLARILPTGIGVENVTYDMRKAASHVVSICQRLASTEALNVTEHTSPTPEVYANRIDFADVFRTPQVVYINLPSTLGTASSAEIARIALYSLIGSARLTPDNERKQVFVFIDEFQRIIANNLELIMQTARSMKVGMILANQSMLDLKKADTDLTPAVRTNTRYKQVFAASNIEELKELIDSSGETLIHQRSFMGMLGDTMAIITGIARVTANEQTSPRLRANDIMLATDAANQSIVQIRRGLGYAQFGGLPFVMRSTFHIDEDEYKARKSSQWPITVTGTFEAQEVPVSSVLGNFAPIDPLITAQGPNNVPTKGTSSGAADLLDQTFEKQAAKRSKYNKGKPPTS
jgi:Helicase HerA, central domain/TraM recognition site of TraD and TraG